MASAHPRAEQSPSEHTISALNAFFFVAVVVAHFEQTPSVFAFDASFFFVAAVVAHFERTPSEHTRVFNAFFFSAPSPMKKKNWPTRILQGLNSIKSYNSLDEEYE
jgi:hypothetical protein